MTTPSPISLAENVRGYLEENVRALRNGDAERGIEGTPRLRIYGALDLALPSIELPGLATVPLGEDTDADLSPEGTETVQRVFTTVGVVAAMKAPNDPVGSRARDPLDILVKASRTLLVGWVPVRKWDPLALRRSRLLLLQEGRAAWQDEYTTYGWRSASRS